MHTEQRGIFFCDRILICFVFDSTFINIDKARTNNDKIVIVGVLYKTPNSSVESSKVNKERNIQFYQMGNFNINILTRKPMI